MSTVASSNRFGWVTAGGPAGPDQTCDVPLTSTADAVVLPTMGSILPHWALVVPRICALSVAQLPSSARKDLLALAGDVGRSLHDSGRITFFEHGPLVQNGVVGCGVDQAHLHVLRADVNLLEAALLDQSVSWIEADITDPWQGIGAREYYLVCSNGHAFVGFPEAAQSQYFRKHIAQLVNLPHQWDYRKWPNYENIRRTYERFRLVKGTSSCA